MDTGSILTIKNKDISRISKKSKNKKSVKLNQLNKMFALVLFFWYYKYSIRIKGV